MAARQYLVCKHCGQRFNKSEKTVLCGGRCKSLYHLKCVPLNTVEKGALAVSRNLWWLCELCSTIDAGSIVPVLSGLISTISVLNKEVCTVKAMVNSSHTRSIKSGVDGAFGGVKRKYNCKTSPITPKIKLKAMNGTSQKLSPANKKGIVKNSIPGVVASSSSSVVCEVNPAGNTIDKHTTTLSTNAEQRLKVEDDIIDQVDIVKHETAGITTENVTLQNETQVGDKNLTSDSSQIKDESGVTVREEEEEEPIVKYSRRSVRPNYKVKEFYYY